MQATLPLEKMTLEEKFMTMEMIWDDIIKHSPDFPSPSWHADVLKERDKLLRNKEEKLIDWDTAKKSLQNSLK